MTDFPAIFTAPMIHGLQRAIKGKEGAKTQTRRFAWASRKDTPDIVFPSIWQKVKVGDLLWVRENFRVQHYHRQRPTMMDLDYAADPGSPPLMAYAHPDAQIWIKRSDDGRKIIPSIHMPRWASRYTLKVNGTKIERLQDISASDVFKEGILKRSRSAAYPASVYAKEDFKSLWVNLYGEQSWEENPELVALTFIVYPRNVDQVEKEI